jgi:TATA-box binding protein (TBP) (component of TFIID and TFIIIB)
MKEIELTQHEYCAEDDTYTLQAQLEDELDLDEIAQEARRLDYKVINMQNLNTVVVITSGPTIHLHGNGKIVANRARDKNKVAGILKEIIKDGEK